MPMQNNLMRYWHCTVVIVTGVLALSACTSGQAKNQAFSSQPNYSITISKDDVRKLFVQATLRLVNDTIWMSQSEFAPLQDGYATFVHGLEATDDKGKPVSLIKVGKGIWVTGLPAPAAIHLKYYVEIGHDGVQWAVSGAFAKAYSVGDVDFFAGRTIFIAAKGNDSAEVQVRFNLPEGWQVITPYEDLSNDHYTFKAANLSSLWDNGNMAGRCVKEEINAGQLKVVIAGSYDMQEGVGLFKNALAKIVDTYAVNMGGTPKGKLAVMGSVAPLASGGETFANSISLMFNYPPGINNKASWGYLLAHEVFHLWNGHTISPVSQHEVEWFVEGFTDYMSKLTAYKTGFINEQEFFEQVAYSYDSYVAGAGIVSMVDAGQHKGQNYNLVYGGGLTAAIAIEAECRKATNNKKGFIDIMKKMYAEFGITGKPYTYSDIVKICSETAGIDLSPFFNTYIQGTAIIPLAKYYSYAGLDVTKQNFGTVILRKANATPQETLCLNAMLGK